MKHPPLKDQFPLRSEPRPGESREGYMWRLCAENGHALPLEVRMALGCLAEYGHDQRTSSVQELIGESLDDQMRQKEAQALASIKGAALSQWMKKAAYPKFCPLCIADSHAHQFLWKLPLVDTCPTHGVLLLEHCSACSRRLSWRYQGVSLACVCGMPIASMTPRSARPWKIVLAKLIAAASDLESPLPTDRVYTLRDVYMALNWAWCFRHLLTRPYIYPSQGWSVTQKKRDRKEPRVWEVILLLQPAETLWWRFHRLLQLRYARSTDVLVQVRADPLLRLSLDCIDELEMHSNPLGARAVLALRTCLAELTADVESMKDLCFHPWSDEDERTEWIKQLSELVMKLLMIGKTNRGPAIGAGGGMTTMPGTWSYHPNDIAVMIVNRLFEIAICGYSDEDIAVFAARWPLPPKLESSSNLLSDLAGYFRNIRPGEQVYVLSLAELVLEQVQSRKGIPA
jgi:hypothetical protein